MLLLVGFLSCLEYTLLMLLLLLLLLVQTPSRGNLVIRAQRKSVQSRCVNAVIQLLVEHTRMDFGLSGFYGLLGNGFTI